MLRIWFLDRTALGKLFFWEEEDEDEEGESVRGVRGGM
jgi:hypothetical protein